MIGSQPMTSSGLTCRATQAAACSLATVTEASALSPPPGTPPVVPLPWLAPDGPLAGVCLVSATVTAPAPNRIAATRIPASTRHLVFSMRRRSHSRNVVASTVPQEGCAAGRLAGGPAAGLTAGIAPGLVAGTPPGRVAGRPPGLGPPGAGRGGGP